MTSAWKRSAVAALLMTVQGCGILIGNVKPVAEKSENYRYLDLSRRDSEWSRLDSSGPDESDAEGTATDISFQSKKTASSITLNSACRESLRLRSQPLASYTRSLLLGMTDINLKEEKNMKVQSLPALQTTVRGRMNDEPIMLRAIVFKKDNCLYDLLYVSRPQHFKTHESTFTKFVNSIQIK